VLPQVQRLKRPQHAILVHGIDLKRHGTIVIPKPEIDTGLRVRWRLLRGGEP
jgi:hypothetical protein